MEDEQSISDKTKIYLGRKLTETETKIKKLKFKKKILKCLYITSTISSIIISTIVASLILPPIYITILSIINVVLTGVSVKFNLQNKAVALSQLISKLNNIQIKLDYVISCNGNLSQTEYNEIFKEFNTVL